MEDEPPPDREVTDRMRSLIWTGIVLDGELLTEAEVESSGLLFRQSDRLCQSDKQCQFVESLLVHVLRFINDDGMYLATDAQIQTIQEHLFGKAMSDAKLEKLKVQLYDRPGRPARRYALVEMDETGYRPIYDSPGFPSRYRATGLLSVVGKKVRSPRRPRWLCVVDGRYVFDRGPHAGEFVDDLAKSKRAYLHLILTQKLRRSENKALIAALGTNPRRLLKPTYLVKLNKVWRLASGPYQGETIEHVLTIDARHVYDIADDKRIRKPEKRIVDAAVSAHYRASISPEVRLRLFGG
jgi:hypothetical protein